MTVKLCCTHQSINLISSRKRTKTFQHLHLCIVDKYTLLYVSDCGSGLKEKQEQRGAERTENWRVRFRWVTPHHQQKVWSCWGCSFASFSCFCVSTGIWPHSYCIMIERNINYLRSIDLHSIIAIIIFLIFVILIIVSIGILQQP